MSVLDGSRYVQTNLSKLQSPGSPSDEGSQSPISDASAMSARGSSRRGFLGTLGAAFGLLAAPRIPEPFELVQPLLNPPEGGEIVRAATLEYRHSDGEEVPVEFHSTPAHIRESFRWKHGEAEGKSSRYRIGSIDLRFPCMAVCYVALHCELNLPEVGDDAPDDHVGWFEPQHLLDYPRVTPTLGDFEEGRLWEGLETEAYSAEVTDVLTRHEAMVQVAQENAKILEHGKYNRICNGCDWWVVVQIGAPIREPLLTVNLKNGVGNADFCGLNFACRIAVPTAAEIARYGLPGESEVPHA